MGSFIFGPRNNRIRVLGPAEMVQRLALQENPDAWGFKAEHQHKKLCSRGLARKRLFASLHRFPQAHGFRHNMQLEKQQHRRSSLSLLQPLSILCSKGHNHPGRIRKRNDSESSCGGNQGILPDARRGRQALVPAAIRWNRGLFQHPARCSRIHNQSSEASLRRPAGRFDCLCCGPVPRRRTQGALQDRLGRNGCNGPHVDWNPPDAS